LKINDLPDFQDHGAKNPTERVAIRGIT